MKLPGIQNPVAFFSSEFAIDNDLPTYSGGLGILTADVINAAATQHFPMVGVGILYNGREFEQHITGNGLEEKRDTEFDHDASFLRHTTKDGKTLIFRLFENNPDILVKAYHIRLSDNTILFLLSTDVDGNPPVWVADMGSLYHGDEFSQVRQQLLLGVGGIKLLEELGIAPNIYHINEGRPIFIIWQIVANLMKSKKMAFGEAWEKAKQKIVYTNHTLVAAGNLIYPTYIVEEWAKPFAQDLGVDPRELYKEGLVDEHNFSITLFALNISSKHSAVSKVHLKYAKEQWSKYDWVSVTNGVNMSRWQDSDLRRLNLSDKDIWEHHTINKRQLMETVIKRTGFGYDPNRLVISWARRLADYKRPREIFSDIERLKKQLENPDRPVQLLFAGNSHSADPNAKSIIEEIIRLFSNRLSGHAIFVPNYNIALANHMVSGSDVWLNTPQGNLEASGTSGMKAIANGVLNCTVLDGWTYEVDWKDTGWVLDPKDTAGSFYHLLSDEIAPCYYKRNEANLPTDWIKMMRKSIETSKSFTADRVLEEYKKYLYS